MIIKRFSRLVEIQLHSYKKINVAFEPRLLLNSLLYRPFTGRWGVLTAVTGTVHTTCNRLNVASGKSRALDKTKAQRREFKRVSDSYTNHFFF